MSLEVIPGGPPLSDDSCIIRTIQANSFFEHLIFEWAC